MKIASLHPIPGILIALPALFHLLPLRNEAVTVSLFEDALNVNGAITKPNSSVPGLLDASGFDFTTGLGRLNVQLSSPGANYVGLFLDHEIDEQINTFFNELGGTTGAPQPGQSWEIDEPGYV